VHPRPQQIALRKSLKWIDLDLFPCGFYALVDCGGLCDSSQIGVLIEVSAMKMLLAVACAMLLTVAVVQVSKDQASTGISVAQLGKGKGKGKAPTPPPIVSKG
jgi:hypothetical protein